MAEKINVTRTYAERHFDKYKESFVATPFSDKMAMAPAKIKDISHARNGKSKGCEGIVTNFSEIRIEENTVAVIYSRGKIERILTTPGKNLYFINEPIDLVTVRDVLEQTRNNKWAFGFKPEEEKPVAFVNLREIRGISFGTDVIPYHDRHFGLDLEVRCFGSFTIQITDPERFVTNVVPAGVYKYDFESEQNIRPLIKEISHSLAVAVTSLSKKYRVSDMTMNVKELFEEVLRDQNHVGSWERRFGFKLTGITLDSIRHTEESKAQVEEYNAKRIPFIAMENTSEKTSEMVIRHQIAEGFKNHGIGSTMALPGGMVPTTGSAMSADVVHALISDQSTVKMEKKINLMERLAALREKDSISAATFEAMLGQVVGL